MRHNLQNLTVGLVHGFGPNTCQVMYALIHIIVDDALHAAHTFLLHGQHG